LTYKNQIRICKRCNKQFIPNNHNHIYCCKKNKIKLKTAIFKCELCGTEFKPLSANAKYCSSKCKKIKGNKNWQKFYRQYVGYEPVKEINCIICGDKFIRKNKRQIYCKNKKCKLEYLRKKAIKSYHKNKEKILEDRRNNVEYCILNKLRMRISCAVKSQGTHKSKRTMKLVGCSVKELKQYLENKFKEGMNWKNYGRNGWHIDHILPCASFNLIKKEEQEKCFHYTNLQPLWAEENLRKNCKVI